MVTLTPPLSKSDAQRALVLADVRGLPSSTLLPPGEALPRDVEVLRDGLAALHATRAELDCRDGGAPFRFLVTQAAVQPNRVVSFTGTARLGERPHAPLLEALRRALGPSLGPSGLRLVEGTPWPLRVESPGTFTPPIAFTVTGAESSQFASSLLLGAARLAASTGHPVSVRVEGALTSAGYLALTERWLGRAGFSVVRQGDALVVGPGTAPSSFPPVPGDWSSLGYLLLLAWRSGVAVARVAFDTGHPDEHVAEQLRHAGLALTVQPGGAHAVTGTPTAGLEVDAERCPDAIPTLAVFASVLPAPSRFLRPGILRHKESDRLEGTLALLHAAGLDAVHAEDALTVRPGRARDFSFDARDDHRLAMSAAVLAHLHGVTLRLRGKASVAKSFPTFWGEAAKVGLAAESLP